MDNNRLRGGSNLSTLVFFNTRDNQSYFYGKRQFQVENFSNYNSYEKKNMKSSTIYSFIYLFRRPFLIYYLFYFFCRSNEQLKGKLRHEGPTEVTTEECMLYFLHHKNGRLAVESTRKPKVCPEKCHLGRTSSKRLNAFKNVHYQLFRQACLTMTACQCSTWHLQRTDAQINVKNCLILLYLIQIISCIIFSLPRTIVIITSEDNATLQIQSCVPSVFLAHFCHLCAGVSSFLYKV